MSETQELAVITPKDLEHLTDLEKEIEGYRKEYSALSIVDENDKDGYELVRKAIGVLRPKRTGLEAERKSVVKPYNDTVSFINSKYKEVVETIESIEKPLKEKKESIDNIVEQKKEAERLAAEQKINERVNDLINNGATFDGQYYSIKNDELGIAETSIGVVDIRTMSDELFKNLLQVVIDKNAKIVFEKERVEKERIAAEELRLENEKKEREKFELEKAELERQQNLMKQQQEEINKQQEAAKQQLVNTRQLQLKALGLDFWGTNYSIAYKTLSTNINHSTLETLSNEDWDIKLDETTKLVTEINSLKKLDAEAKEKQAEIDKAENEKRIAQQSIENEQKRKQEEKEKAELELAQADDKTKYESILAQIKALQVPDFKSNIYKNKAKIIKDFIADLK